MITEPRIDKFGLLAEQKLRDYIESFERKYLDYRYPEVEDGTITSETAAIGQTEAPANAGPGADILGQGAARGERPPAGDVRQLAR